MNIDVTDGAATPATILVIDDDADIRLLVSEVLRLAGHRVVTAASGVEGLDALSTRTVVPDLVLLDVQMPDLDGWDTLRAIRRMDGGDDLAVVLCTVKSAPADVALAWSLACDGYLSKPFAIADLTDEVAAVLALDGDARRARRAAAATAVASALSMRG